MSIDNISQSLQQALAKLTHQLTIKGEGDFAKTLNLGQIIKGKVLRHYEGSRYLVSFNGQEKVVDSAIPLKTNELIYGRVIGLDDQIKLQRVATNVAAEGGDVASKISSPSGHSSLSDNERLLADLYSKYKATLTDNERALVVSQMNKSGNANLIALSSLVLSKLGLLQAPEFLRGLNRNLQGNKNNNPSKLSPVLRMTVAEQDDAHLAIKRDSTTATQQIAGMLLAGLQEGGYQEEQQLSDEKVSDDQWLHPELNSLTDNNQGQGQYGSRREDYQEWLLGRWILNMQNEGSVSHRLSTFPVWFGDNLVEVNLAMFDQRKDVLPDRLQHKMIVFSIKTDYLGSIEIKLTCVDRNLNMDVLADSEYTAVCLAGYIDELKNSLQELGWTIGDITYASVQSFDEDRLVKTVMEHHITQNSLNQLI